jgi:hypothetical protein
MGPQSTAIDFFTADSLAALSPQDAKADHPFGMGIGRAPPSCSRKVQRCTISLCNRRAKPSAKIDHREEIIKMKILIKPGKSQIR